MFEGAKAALIEDRDVLTEVHKGMKTSRTRHINLGIDAGACGFARWSRDASARKTRHENGGPDSQDRYSSGRLP